MTLKIAAGRMMAISIVSMMLAWVAMAIPIVAGIIIIVAARGRGLGYPACAVCKYDLTATIGTASRCPECGAEFARVGILPPREARKRILLWTGVILLVAPLSCAGVGIMAMRLTVARAQQSAAAARQAAVASQLAAMAQQQPRQTGTTTAPSNSATTSPQP